MQQEILTTSQLSKRYGRIQAIRDLDLTVEKGQVVGILGPNGSGKTTTLSIIMGIISQDRGTYRWFGRSPGAWANKRIGSLIETPNFHPYLSLEQNLNIACLIKEVPGKDIARVLKVTGLEKRARYSYSTLSLGMKQRLALASVLLGDPEVLVLDEPANGLDPEGIAEVRGLISDEAARGKTIILASHILDEVEKVCSHVIILKEGLNIASGPAGQLLSAEDQVILGSADPSGLEKELQASGLIKSLVRQNDHFIVTPGEGIGPEELNKYLFEKNIILNKLDVLKKSLESQFLELVKQTQ